ncbi:MAG TPA: hypothetical protein VG125_09440 [Pirellulales bacterium]|jgi:hypothetical protein|nr:hypothetical protein [Pirellulales bacterium]
MAKKKQPAVPSAPQIFAASLGANGTVIKGHPIVRAQAEVMRQAGLDVVVCGPDLAANRKLAGQIEGNANGKCKRCPPHATSGNKALPHYQPDPRPPSGHTFYETPNRRAV